MSDSRVRELERAWRASGREADEVAWLRERVRAGELAPERLELAAFLAANGIVGPEAHLLAALPRELVPWLLRSAPT